jgi:hypothetical protein
MSQERVFSVSHLFLFIHFELYFIVPALSYKEPKKTAGGYVMCGDANVGKSISNMGRVWAKSGC